MRGARVHPTRHDERGERAHEVTALLRHDLPFGEDLQVRADLRCVVDDVGGNEIGVRRVVEVHETGYIRTARAAKGSRNESSRFK